MMQTGRLFSGGVEHPHASAAALGVPEGRSRRGPAHVLLPKPIGRSQVATFRTATPRATSANPHDPFILNADPETG